MNAVDQIPATRSTKPITHGDYTRFTSDECGSVKENCGIEHQNLQARGNEPHEHDRQLSRTKYHNRPATFSEISP